MTYPAISPAAAFTRQSLVLMTLMEQGFENNFGKGENAGTHAHIFSFLHNIFYPFKQKSIIWLTLSDKF